MLASLHFNENVQRETQIGENGQYLRVCYPKYKLGEEVVRDVKIPQTYGYVDEMKKLLFSLSRAVMKEKFTEYSSKAPTSLASQFPDRVGRTEAVEAYNKRIKKNTNTQLFPTGEEQNALLKATQESQSSQSKSTRKATNTCRTCKQPMRGHSKAKCQQNAGY